jgi:predicted acyltransferase (DUF342 family)
MALSTANLNTSTDTFLNWFDKTNTLLDAYSTTIITTAANSSGGITTGNASLIGIFNSNTVAVGTSLRGGNVTTSGLLTITSNLSITGNTLFTGNASFTNNMSVTGNAVVTGALIVNGDITVSGSFAKDTGNTNFNAGVLYIDAVNNRVGINNTAPGVALRVTGAADITTTANLQGNTTIGGTLITNGAASFSNTITVTGNTTVNKDFVTNANTYLSANLFVIAGSSISINAQSTFTNNVIIQRNLTVHSNLSVNAITNFGVSNADLGSNVTTYLTILSFPKTTHKGGKFTINLSRANTSQMSEMLLTHDSNDNTNITVFGTVVCPTTTGELGSITAAINNANVELQIQQTNANTAVKIMAQLF